MTRGKLAIYAYWAVAALVGLVVLLSVSLNFLDWNQYRDTLSSLASSQLGMRVELAGKVSVSLVPRPAVSAEEVRLFPAGSSPADVVATAGRIDMRLGVTALLKGQLAIQHLGLDGLDLALEEAEGGGWRVKGWPDVENGDGEDFGVQMERLEINGGTLHLHELSGQERLIEGLSFKLKGSLPRGPLDWDGSFVAAGEKVISTGRLRPGRDGAALSLKTDVTLRGGVAQVSGRISDGGFAGRVQVDGDDAAAFVSAAQTIAAARKIQASMPSLPFGLDLQIDREAGLYRAVSRTLNVGETRGRLDLTVAEKDTHFHVAGSASVGTVDFGPWVAAIQNSDQVEAVQKSEGSAKAIVTGSIDVTVEGVTIGDSLIQQLDAVVLFSGTDIRLTNMQALLPGGSGLFFTGDVGARDGGGKLQLSSGNLPALLRWAGINVSGQIPSGRLATGDLAADVRVDGQGWALQGVKGRIDTTNFAGSMDGRWASAWPAQLSIEADTVNLDAYLPEAKAGQDFKASDIAGMFTSLPEAHSVFSIKAEKVFWGGERYDAALISGDLARDQVRLTDLSARHGKGSLAATAALRPGSKDAEVEFDGKFQRWSLPALQALMPDAKAYMRALRVTGVDGDVSFSGALSNLHVSASLLDGAERQLIVNGGGSYTDAGFGAFDLQGTMRHENLRPLVAQLGYELKAKVPTDITYSLVQESGKPLAVKLSGAVAGGQALVEGASDANTQRFTLTYDHRMARYVAMLSGIGIAMPAPSEPLRIAASVKVSGEEWAVDGLDIRNGDARLAGNLSGKGQSRLDGQLQLAGLTLGNRAASGKASDSESSQLSSQLVGWAGRVGLSLDQIVLSGQRLQAPKAQLVAGDGVVRFDLGEGATVNGRPATLAFDLAGSDAGGDLALDGKLKLETVDLGAALGAGGLKDAVSGVAGVEFAFKGQGETTSAMLDGLRGEGSVSGKAGVLNFLSVPTLVRELGRAPSTSGFLTSIGTWLRDGATSFSTVEARFTLDAGTALLEKAVATGDWGNLALDGQVNFVDRFLNLKGNLALTSPPDAPAIPVVYEGPLDNPRASWASTALERFAIAGIERRLRATLTKDLAQKPEGEEPSNPGAEVFLRAFDLLGKLRQKQEDKKEEPKPSGGAAPAPGTEGQKP